jgi:hypothetical protein
LYGELPARWLHLRTRVVRVLLPVTIVEESISWWMNRVGGKSRKNFDCFNQWFNQYTRTLSMTARQKHVMMMYVPLVAIQNMDQAEAMRGLDDRVGPWLALKLAVVGFVAVVSLSKLYTFVVWYKTPVVVQYSPPWFPFQ